MKFHKAILVIHGFAGGVYDQESLCHELETIHNYDVFTFTLPGHDGDFSSKITMDNWINKAENEINFLIKKGYKKIYLVGHSMGGVIASYLASKYKQVKKLVLVAPAFMVYGFEHEKIDIDTFLRNTPKVFEQYGAKLVINRMLKLPTNCYREFFNLIQKYQLTPQDITIPTLVFRGDNDTIVPIESIDYVYNNLNSKLKKKVIINGSSHDVFRENKSREVTEYIIRFFKNTKIVNYLKENI